MINFQKHIKLFFQGFIFAGQQICKIKIAVYNAILFGNIPINSNCRLNGSKPFVVYYSKVVFIYFYKCN